MITIDKRKRTVLTGKRATRLSPVEFSLLEALGSRFPKTATHQELLESVWGAHACDHKNYLKLYVHYLRSKLEKDPSRPRLIVTNRKLGYRLTVQLNPVRAHNSQAHARAASIFAAEVQNA